MKGNDATTTSVAIVGVGTTGVHALRWAVGRKFARVVAFDEHEGCGGIWRCGAQLSPAYESLYTNSSGVMMVAGDTRPPGDAFAPKTAFPKWSETVGYYEWLLRGDAYESVAPNMARNVRWRTRVTGVRKPELGNPHAKWRVEYVDLTTNEANVEEFDRVMVCSGKLWDPSWPSWAPPAAVAQSPPSPTTTRMTITHSRFYRSPLAFKGKRVVVVGVGNSALDISLELALDPTVPKPVMVSARRGAVVIPIRGFFGLPSDIYLTSRAFQYGVSPGTRARVMQDLARPTNAEFRRLGMPPPPQPSLEKLFAPENPTSNCKATDEYLAALRRGDIVFVDGVVGVDDAAATVALGNGTVVKDVGAVICCTGYRIGLDYLEPKAREAIVRSARQSNGRVVEFTNLYKDIVCPVDPTLAVLTFLTTFGNESIVGSMQARWVTRFWQDAKMQESFAKTDHAKALRGKEAQLTASNVSVGVFVRYLVYMDALAKDLGAMPNTAARLSIWSVASSAESFVQAVNLLFGAAVSSQWFMDGPDACAHAPGVVGRVSCL